MVNGDLEGFGATLIGIYRDLTNKSWDIDGTYL
jgi:hypothetical protein